MTFMAAGLAWKMNDTAHHRCCCHRECDRKPDLSRLPRLRLRPSPSLTVLVFQTMSFQKEEPPWVQNYTLAACLMRRPKLNSPRLFAAHGTVASARVIADKFTGQSRGFGFVEMSTPEEAQAAIAALNGTQMDGRSLTVNEAKPQEPRSGGGGGRFSGGGRGSDFGGRNRY